MTATPEPWERIKEIVADALELPTAKRDEFVQRVCSGDARMLEEVRSLLAFQPTAEYAQAVVPALAPGTILNGRYVIERALAQGGFATAWLALDQQLVNRPVVIKRLSGTAQDPYIRRKFDDELRALSALEHPHIIAPLGSGYTDAGLPFIVTQYAEGQTLGALLGQGLMPLGRIAKILAQIGHTLAFIHEAGIVHRDLKPENIMVQTFSDGVDHVRLIDFGIATVGYVGAPRTTRIIGSLVYMAPEQLLGEVGPATDVYALGAIAYEAVAGAVPYPANNPVELVNLQARGLNLRTRQLRAELPPAAEALILEALQGDPALRPRDAGGYADRLAAALVAAPAPARKKTSSLLYAAIAAALVVLLLGLVFILRRAAPAASPNLAVLPVPMVSPVVVPVVTLEIERHSPPGFLSPDSGGHLQLRAGDEFRLVVRNAVAGHLYLFSESGNSAGLHILFPSSTSNHGNSLLASVSSVSIPESEWLRIDGSAASDSLDLIWSPVALPACEAAIRFANERDVGVVPDGPDLAAIRRILGENLQPLRFEDGAWKIYPTDGHAFVVSRLEIEHGGK